MNVFESEIIAYLLNSLWQVPLIFAAVCIAAHIARPNGPRTAHRIWVSALILEAALPACKFHLDRLLHELFGYALRPSSSAGGETRVVVGVGAISGNGILRIPPEVLPFLAAAYGCSLLYFAGRLAWGLWKTHTMDRQARRVTLTEEAMQQWNRYCKVFGCERVDVAVSPMVAGPVTVGIRRGVMLVPPGFLESIAQEDLDSVAAHELAHIQRRDFLKSLVYGLVSLPVTYHPLLWLTRSRIAGRWCAIRWPRRPSREEKSMHGRCCGWPRCLPGENQPGHSTPSEYSMPTSSRGELWN